MLPLIPFLVVAYAVLYAFALSIPPIPHFASIGSDFQQRPLQDSLDAWIEKEEDIALDKLLANVAPGGRNTKNTVPGTAIASPSRSHPDYYYQWVRDAAITLGTLGDIYAEDPWSSRSADLNEILSVYVSLQKKLQDTDTPSGKASDLSSLGEPKFNVDGSPYTKSWGRPQRDGSALRAITLMSYLRAYNASHPSLWDIDSGDDWFNELYDPVLPANSVIKRDLEYVSHYWNQSGFDLWEEINGLHFFTAMVQLRALREGADLAAAFGDMGAAKWYREQASYLNNFVKTFWDEKKGHIVETLNSDRSGLDCGILLGSLHSLPPPNSTHEPIYPPYSDGILITLLKFIRDQESRFPINLSPVHTSTDIEEDENDTITKDVDGIRGVGLGRYPNDMYDGYDSDPTHGGGNPWFLCTSSAAHVLYLTSSHLSSTNSLNITPLNYPFYAALLAESSLEVQKGKTYGEASPVLHSVVERLRSLGDEFLGVVKTHVDAEGRLSEQFDRVTGYERGAGDLTWSYSSFLDAVRARKDAMEAL